LIEAKRRGMQDVVARLSHSEDFAQLASATSEDEAAKNPGGDLGFFSADRMPRSRQSSEPRRSMNFAGSLRSASGLFLVECKKLELRDCQFERRLKQNFNCI